MSYYLKEGEILWPTDKNAFDIKKTLPVGTYVVKMHMQRGFYLEPIAGFDINGKIYGNTERRADRILGTFDSRPNTTGVLLAGEKGGGKTLLAKLISKKAAAKDIPTLVINTPFTGDSFNTFIQNIDQPCVVVFDEFEKVFDNAEQEQILTLLDGMFPTKKLFILTVNDKYRVNSHMRNRPGRIFYMLEFGGLEVEFIREYCEDNLNDKSHIDQICRLSHLFEAFNFDMLKALVEEMNRYNETPTQALDMLNAKPHDAGRDRHQVTVVCNGKEINSSHVYPSTMRGNPIAMDQVEVTAAVPMGKDSDGDEQFNSIEIELTQSNIVKVDVEAGLYVYNARAEGKDFVVTMQREDIAKRPGNWYDMV